MTTPVNAALHRRDLAPGRHYLDSGYGSARPVLDAARLSGITPVTPLPADSSRQARAGDGYDRTAFAIDYDAAPSPAPRASPALAGPPPGRKAVASSSSGSASPPAVPARPASCAPPPAATAAADHLAPRPARTAGCRPCRAARRRLAGRLQAPPHRGCREPGCHRHRVPRARYRGLGKTHLEHVYAAVPLNLCRPDAHWNDTPEPRKNQPSGPAQPRHITNGKHNLPAAANGSNSHASQSLSLRRASRVASDGASV